MGSAWTGDWEGRINDFSSRQGYASIWDYLGAHPATPLVDVANTIGDVAAIQIERLVIPYCLERGLIGECLRDTIVRSIHKQVPDGWGSKNDFAHAMAFTGLAAFPQPYSEIGRAIGKSLKEFPPAQGWLPASRDDAVLMEAFNRALESLPAEAREMALRGGFIKPPGSIYWAAVEPIWKSISIYDGPEDFLGQFAAVRIELGHLFAAHWCQSEVCNGGFHQFFHNSTGVLAPEAAAGFVAIGMLGCAGVVAQAIEHFGAPYPRDRGDRMESLRAVSGQKREEWNPFTKLDSRFYELLKNENGGFAIAADRYADKIR